MRKNKIIFPILIALTILVITLSGCSNNKENEDMKSKIERELDYLDTQIISILNDLNNISLQNYTVTPEEITLGEDGSSGGSSSGGSSSQSGGSSEGSAQGSEQKQSSSQSQSASDTKESKITIMKMEPENVLSSDENDVDWNSIKNNIQTINESWGVVILDLSNMNVDNNDILNFSSTLDDCILSIKDEKKTDTLTNIAKLYSFIPKFERGISAENSTQNIKQVKSYIINAYSLVEKDDWTAIGNNISECEKTFKNITNDMEYMKDKEYKVNKTYVLIKELQNSLTYKDKKLFYVKYKNVMESINTL